MMEPGQPVYAAIVRAFGPDVVLPDGHLDRGKLAELAFQGGRLNELNGIVHPAVMAAQKQWMDQVFARNPAAVAVIESALIFEVERDARLRGVQEGVMADWRRRLDRIVVLTAPARPARAALPLKPTDAPACRTRFPMRKRPRGPTTSSTTPAICPPSAPRCRLCGCASRKRATLWREMSL
jgi:dephospho-CoA kinase